MRLHLAGCLPQVFESCGFGVQIAPPTFATAGDAEALANKRRTWGAVFQRFHGAGRYVLVGRLNEGRVWALSSRSEAPPGSCL